MEASQRALRATGIGGTDISAIVGKNPYRSPFDVWLEKTGRQDSKNLDDVPHIRWGKILEPVLAAEYEKETGIPIIHNRETFVHPSNPIVLCTPDALWDMDRGAVARGGAEFKTAGPRMIDKWGNIFTDDVPEEYLIQATWYAGFCREVYGWDVGVW